MNINSEKVNKNLATAFYGGDYHQDHPAYLGCDSAFLDCATDFTVLTVMYRATPDGVYKGGAYIEVYDVNGDLLGEAEVDGSQTPLDVLCMAYERSMDDCGGDLSLYPASAIKDAGYINENPR